MIMEGVGAAAAASFSTLGLLTLRFLPLGSDEAAAERPFPPLFLAAAAGCDLVNDDDAWVLLARTMLQFSSAIFLPPVIIG